ncbi:phage tail protein, partial [Pseudomonas sp. SIMBA_041]|uniref:phage tail protein n=1 Tax=Pseudomonas sp. SIMBA_041 TaxID=3085782 RepID=UPI00397ADD77
QLINEWRRAPINQIRVDPANPNTVITEQIIPPEVGGEWIREIGLYDVDGDLVAVANCAPSYKPLLDQGSGKTQVVRMNFIVSSSANIVLKIDPAVVLATREYVDLKIQEELAKLDHKQSARVAATAAITLSNLQTVDDVAVATGDRVLVTAQALAQDNGIYVASADSWTRAADADNSLEVTPGLFIHVEQGTTNGDSLWQLVTDAPINLGTTSLQFDMIAGGSGAGVGTFRSVTVDALGRVVAGTNPTTLDGYGITDALPVDGTAVAATQLETARTLSVSGAA